MIRRNQIVNLDDALDYILNRNTSQFESSDNLYSYEKENTDFDNTEPPPIIEINNKMRIVQRQIYGNTPEHSVCNKKPKVYKWVNKPFESIFNKFGTAVLMPPTKEVTATPYFLEFIVAAMIENIYTQTTLYYLKKLEIVAIS